MMVTCHEISCRVLTLCLFELQLNCSSWTPPPTVISHQIHELQSSISSTAWVGLECLERQQHCDTEKDYTSTVTSHLRTMQHTLLKGTKE